MLRCEMKMLIINMQTKNVNSAEVISEANLHSASGFSTTDFHSARVFLLVFSATFPDTKSISELLSAPKDVKWDN